MDDIGLRTVDAVRKLLMIDEEWTVPLERGLRWWGFRTGQEIVAGRPFEIDGEAAARITVRTPVLTRPTVDDHEIDVVLALMNATTTGGAFRVAPNGEIVHELGALTGEEMEGWVTNLIGSFSTLALTSGVRCAAAHAERLGSKPIETAHPTTGWRQHSDEILNVPSALFVPDGQEPSAWADDGPSFANAAEMFNRGPGFAADTTGEHGLLCEVGFGAERTSLLIVDATGDEPPSAPNLPASTPDPEYGSGLIAWLVLPEEFDEKTGPGLAAILNASETAANMPYELAGAMHFGAWTVRGAQDNPMLVYRVFFPNALRSRVMVENVALHMWHRSARVSRLLHPDEEPMSGEAIAEMALERALAWAAARGLPTSTEDLTDTGGTVPWRF